MDVIEVVAESVRVHEETKQHTVVLKERGGDRVLPIWIGPDQAHAISTRLGGIVTERPMTHDVVVELAKALRGHFDRVVIHGLTPFEEGKSLGTFMASLFVI